MKTVGMHLVAISLFYSCLCTFFLHYHPYLATPSFLRNDFILVAVDFIKSPKLAIASGIPVCTQQTSQCRFKVSTMYTLLRQIAVVLQDCIQEADMPLVILNLTAMWHFD